LAITSLLAGCHGESVTGPPAGNHTLTGQVVPVGDLAGSSPAGINVSCSGQVGTTDAAGRFTFMGLPDAAGQYTILSTGSASGNLQLNFSRPDGISASGSVSAAASSVVVNLQKKQAAIVVTGLSKREIEGLVTEISMSSITVNDASTGGPVTAMITPSTVIRKGNQTLTWDKLNKGDRVHVKASVNADATLTAFEIMLQQSGGTGGGQTQELEGPITAVSSTSITVNNASTGGDVTAMITGSTVIRKGNTTLTWDNLNIGDQVHVKTVANADSTLTATEIMLQNPAN
jgi:hypothetical protein